jgi:hypothetical protein
MAARMASKVARLTLLAYSEASSGLSQWHVGLALDGVDRGGYRCGDRGPGRHLGLVGRLTNRRVGRRGESAHGRHRKALETVSEVELGAELRGDVGVQAVPRRRTGGGQLGVQPFFRLAHLMACPIGQPAQRFEVLAHLVAHRGQLVDPQRVRPVGQPGEQRANHRLTHLELAEQRAGVFVA